MAIYYRVLSVLFTKDFDRHCAFAYSNQAPGEMLEVIRRALLAHFAFRGMRSLGYLRSFAVLRDSHCTGSRLMLP